MNAKKHINYTAVLCQLLLSFIVKHLVVTALERCNTNYLLKDYKRTADFQGHGESVPCVYFAPTH